MRLIKPLNLDVLSVIALSIVFDYAVTKKRQQPYYELLAALAFCVNGITNVK